MKKIIVLLTMFVSNVTANKTNTANDTATLSIKYAAALGNLDGLLTFLDSYKTNRSLLNQILQPLTVRDLKNLNTLHNEASFYSPFPINQFPNGPCFVKALLEYGFDTQIPSNNMSLLSIIGIGLATKENQQLLLEILTTILSYGADINAGSFLDEMKFMLLHDPEKKQIIQAIVDKANIWSGGKTFNQTQTNLLQQLLLKAGEVTTKNDRDVIVQQIQQTIDNGANPNTFIAAGVEQVSALHYALMLGADTKTYPHYPVFEIANTLINGGAKQNAFVATNKASIPHGNNPLLTIVQYANDGRTGGDDKTGTNLLLPVALINLLMTNYGDPLAINDQGISAIDYVQTLINKNPTTQYYQDLMTALMDGMKLYAPYQVVIYTKKTAALAKKTTTESKREIGIDLGTVNLDQTNADANALFDSKSKPTLQTIINTITAAKVCDTPFKQILGPIIQGYIRVGGLLSDKDDKGLTVFDYAKTTDMQDYLALWKKLEKPRALMNVTISIDFLKNLILQNTWGASTVNYDQFNLYLDQYIKTNDINAYDTNTNMTLFCYASIPSKLPADQTILTALLNHGANINSLCGNHTYGTNTNQFFANILMNHKLFFATAVCSSYANEAECVSDYRENCSNLNLISLNILPTTPLGFAILTKSDTTVTFLLSKGADIFLAAQCKNSDITSDIITDITTGKPLSPEKFTYKKAIQKRRNNITLPFETPVGIILWAGTTSIKTIITDFFNKNPMYWIATNTQSPKHFTINNATYGSSTQRKDVTDVLKKLTNETEGFFIGLIGGKTVMNKFFGDPSPNNKKFLFITCTDDAGNFITKTIPEDMPFVLPLTIAEKININDPILGEPTLTQAIYGTKEKNKNVIEIIKTEMQHSPSEEFIPYLFNVKLHSMNNQFNENPAPGEVKNLTVTYTYKNGATLTKTFPETMSFSLPFITTFGFGPSAIYQSPSQGQPTLTKATYGFENNILDVTEFLKTKLSNAPYNFAGGKNSMNKEFGSDPAPGKTKTLTITCTYNDGTTITKTFPENQPFSLS